ARRSIVATVGDHREGQAKLQELEPPGRSLMTFATKKRAAARIAARAGASLVALLAVAALAAATLSIAPATAQQPARSAAPPTPPGGGAAPPASSAAPPLAEVSSRPPLGGYLGPQHLPDHRVFLPPPPAAGSALASADVAIFEETRKLENGARWQL